MIKKVCGGVCNFARRRPSLFIVIIIAVVLALFYITYESFHYTSTSEFCGKCHVESHSGPGAEYYTWEKNVHSYVNVGCIDCHGKPGIVGYIKAKFGGIRDIYGEIFLSKEHKMKILTEAATNEEYAAKLVPGSWCLFCHSDEVNKETRDTTAMSFLGLKMRNIDKVVNPEYREKYGLPDVFKGPITGVDPNHTLHVKDLGLSCANCHMGVAHGGEFYNRPKMETCFACHDEKQSQTAGGKIPANDDCVACHTLPLQEQEGTFLESKGIPATPWLMPSITGECSSCHEDAFTPPTAETCVGCHDESYADIYDSFRSDFDEQKAQLTPVWQELFKSIDKMNNADRAKFNELNYFYTLIDMDQSKGIHNTDLMNAIFEKSNALAAELKKSMDLRK